MGAKERSQGVLEEAVLMMGKRFGREGSGSGGEGGGDAPVIVVVFLTGSRGLRPGREITVEKH